MSENLNDRLSILNIEMENSLGDAVDLNADIINATRKMAHNLIIIRNGHLGQAERLLDIVQALAESASIGAELTADLIAAEWGIEVLSEEQFEDLEDEEGDE